MRIQIQKRCVASLELVKSAIAATENGFGNIVRALKVLSSEN